MPRIVFNELARAVESGETIVVTRNGRPVLDLVPHKPQRGLRLDALAEFEKRNGIKRSQEFSKLEIPNADGPADCAQLAHSSARANSSLTWVSA